MAQGQQHNCTGRAQASRLGQQLARRLGLPAAQGCRRLLKGTLGCFEGGCSSGWHRRRRAAQGRQGAPQAGLAPRPRQGGGP